MMPTAETPKELKPLTPQALTVTEVPQDSGQLSDADGKPVPYAISAYRADGEIIAYCDSTSPDALMNYDLRNKVYAYRLAIGMASAGMEPLTGPTPIAPDDRVVCLLKKNQIPAGQRAYRRLFKFTPGI